jgi:hypothetical protein
LIEKSRLRGIFPIYKKEDRSFAGFSAGRRWENLRRRRLKAGHSNDLKAVRDKIRM